MIEDVSFAKSLFTKVLLKFGLFAFYTGQYRIGGGNQQLDVAISTERLNSKANSSSKWRGKNSLFVKILFAIYFIHPFNNR